MKKIILFFILLIASLASYASVAFTYVVSKDGSGDFTTVQAAIDAAASDGTRSIIYIKNGEYYEMINVPAGKVVSLIGQDADSVIITYDRNRGAGSEYSDFRDITTAQFYGDDLYCENITIVNSSGDVGQAEAHYVSGDRQIYRNCRFLGFQDTQRTNGGCRAYFKDCFIQGATDFIFGGGLMYYEGCTLNCVKGGGYICAPEDAAFVIPRTNTSSGRFLRIGYIFHNCRITADNDVSDGSYYLGRPWKEYSGVFYDKCKMGPHINATGWKDWNGAENTACMCEYKSSDFYGDTIDLSSRADWSFRLDSADRAFYDIDYIYNKVNSSSLFDPVSICKNVPFPYNVILNGTKLTWNSVSAAKGYVILKNGEFLASTDKNEYDVDDESAVYSVKSISEYGALSNAVNADVKSSDEILKAFPTAEGFGKFATGGRGGNVVYVTNLEDDSNGLIQGSLRWALNQYKSDFTVVFAVSGTINLVSELKVAKDNFTIAGQSAPGYGICTAKNKVNFGGSKNFIVRNMRFRIGQTDINGNLITSNSFGAENTVNFILDHCTFGWSVEENCNTFDTHFHTVQWCIVHEGLYNAGHPKGARGYGGQWGGSSATYHHNLLADNHSRSPRFNGSRGNDPSTQDVAVYMEYINNVNYNWGKVNSCYGAENTSENRLFYGYEENFINNYYKPGPSSPSGSYFVQIDKAREGAESRGPDKWYVSGNIMEGNSSVTSNNWLGINNASGYDINSIRVDTVIESTSLNQYIKYRFNWDDYTYKNYETATNAYNSVLKKAGAFPRDYVDKRVVSDVRNGSYTFGNKGMIDYPSQAEGYYTYPVYDIVIDNDSDGMADDWEIANNLDPNNPDDRNKTTKLGYTALEVYLDGLMGESISHSFVSETKSVSAKYEIKSYINSDILYFITDKKINAVKIYNIAGNCIKKVLTNGSNAVSLSDIPLGNYIAIAYIEGGKLVSSKFLKK